MGFEALSAQLWKERAVLDRLGLKLAFVCNIVETGRAEWLPMTADEIAELVEELPRLAAAHRNLVQACGGERVRTLASLSAVAPPPWNEILREHREALLPLRAHVEAMVFAAEACLSAFEPAFPASYPADDADWADRELIEVARVGLLDVLRSTRRALTVPSLTQQPRDKQRARSPSTGAPAFRFEKWAVHDEPVLEPGRPAPPRRGPVAARAVASGRHRPPLRGRCRRRGHQAGGDRHLQPVPRPPQLRMQMGGSPRRGVLFEGPPRTGKTHLAKAMAGEAGVPLFETESELRGLLTVAMGGLVAEEAGLGEASSAAAGDLAAATTLAAQMVGATGVGGSRVSLDAAAVPGAANLVAKVLADHRARPVLERLLADAETRARRLVESNQAALRQLAQALVEHDELTGDEVRAILERHQRQPRAAAESAPAWVVEAAPD